MPKGIYNHPRQCGFQKGHKYNNGKKFTKEHKIKIGLSNKGKTRRHFNSKETRKKISEAALKDGRMPSFKGHKHSKKSKEKISLAKKGKNLKEKHWNWLGGISFEPYGLEFNNDLKEVIRNRDRRKCQICEKTELECKRKLDCHHIDYNKLNNDPKNLISLCINCHMKTNFNRNYWIKFFKKII